MWVSRAKWNSLVERLERLEAIDRYDPPYSITVYDVSQAQYMFPMPSERVKLKDLVQRIMTHLGLGLKYRGGVPGGADLVPLTPPTAAMDGEKK